MNFRTITVDYLNELEFEDLCVLSLDEEIELMYDAYKHYAAKQHLAETPFPQTEKFLLSLIGIKLIEACKVCNRKTGSKRWNESLPSTKEVFAREHDGLYREGQMEDTEPEPEQPRSTSPEAHRSAASARKDAGGVSLPKKERSGKIPDETVIEIRNRLKAGEKPKDVAKLFGIHASNISDIKLGKGRYGFIPQN